MSNSTYTGLDGAVLAASVPEVSPADLAHASPHAPAFFVASAAAVDPIADVSSSLPAETAGPLQTTLNPPVELAVASSTTTVIPSTTAPSTAEFAPASSTTAVYSNTAELASASTSELARGAEPGAGMKAPLADVAEAPFEMQDAGMVSTIRNACLMVPFFLFLACHFILLLPCLILVLAFP
jgi:hypothetical protein